MARPMAATERNGVYRPERWVADSTLSARYPIYTRANVGEVFPDPVTPLTFDSGLWLAELGWRDAWARMGAFEPDEFADDEYVQLGVVGGYCYLNASLIRLFGERAPGLSWQVMDEQFFGAQPGIPPYEEQAGDVRPDLTERIGATFAWALSVERLSDLADLTEDMRSTKRWRDERPDLTTLTDRELVARYVELIGLHRNLFAHHLFATYMATVPVGIIQAVTAAIGRPELLMVLIAGVGEVDSAAPSMALWELSRVVGASPELSVAFDSGVTGLLERLERSGSQAAQAFLVGFRAFVHDYGSRGPNEWETRSPTWETRPELALAAIDRMRLAPDAASPDAHQSARSAERQGDGGRGPRRGRRRRGHPRAAGRGAPGGHGLVAGAGADEDQQHPPDPRGPDGHAGARLGVRWHRARSTRWRTSASSAWPSCKGPSSPIRTASPTRSAGAGRATASCRTWSRRSSSSATRRIPRRGPGGTPPCSTGWLRAGRSRACPAAPGWPRAGPGSCSTRTTPRPSIPATCWSPPSPIRRGRRCSCRPRRSSSTSGRR